MTTLDLAHLREQADLFDTYPDIGIADLSQWFLEAGPDVVRELLDAAALGIAWSRVEAALPDGWVLAEVRIHDDRSEWGAEAANDTGEGPYRAMGYGPTPTAALLALAEKLEARA